MKMAEKYLLLTHVDICNELSIVEREKRGGIVSHPLRTPAQISPGFPLPARPKRNSPPPPGQHSAFDQFLTTNIRARKDSWSPPGERGNRHPSGWVN